jgi:hypothetical protein
MCFLRGVHPALEHHLQRPGGSDELGQSLTPDGGGQIDEELGQDEAHGFIIGGQTNIEADRHLQSCTTAWPPDRGDEDRGRPHDAQHDLIESRDAEELADGSSLQDLFAAG